MSSLEYKALQQYYALLEVSISDHLKPITNALAQSSTVILTPEQRSEILDFQDKLEGAKRLLEIVTRSVKQVQDSFIFDTLLEVADVSGNLGMQDLVTNIKSYCHKEYRRLFPEPSNSPGDECEVFISYGRESETNKFVDLLKSRLKSLHLKVFIDRTGISPGDRWPQNIANALHSCKAFVAVLTKKYVKSLYCRGELFQAVHVNKKIFTAVRESGWNQEPSGKSVQAEVGSIQYASVQDGANCETNLSELIESISNHCQYGPERRGEQRVEDETLSPQPKRHCSDGAESSQSGEINSKVPQRKRKSRSTKEDDLYDSDSDNTSHTSGHDEPPPTKKNCRLTHKGGASLLQVNTHLQPVWVAVWEVQTEWRNLGRALKIPDHAINSIAYVDNQPGECLYNVLKEWMQSGKATIHDLLKALEHVTVGHKHIADNILSRKGKNRTEVGL